jgi:acetylornithine/succinyldiaminopimelate/putrescine aminotransferase
VTHVFHRYPRTQLPVAIAGQGIHTTDSSGKRYLDASGGAAVSCLGHGHPRIIAANRRQEPRILY